VSTRVEKWNSILNSIVVGRNTKNTTACRGNYKGFTNKKPVFHRLFVYLFYYLW